MINLIKLVCDPSYLLPVESSSDFFQAGHPDSFLQFHLEACHIDYFYYEPSSARQHMEKVKEASGLSVDLTGWMMTIIIVVLVADMMTVVLVVNVMMMMTVAVIVTAMSRTEMMVMMAC